MARIQDRDRLYEFLLRYENMTFHWAFNKLEYRGLSNFPTDGAIILAPNHCNTLMDALAVLSINNDPKVFVARADIFKKPRLAKFLRFIKILPISRIRDGKEALLNNGDTIEESISAICDGVPFCILPEGAHRPKHSLLPLKKGIARIAMGVIDRVGDKMPVYIVPIGLEYGDYFEYRSTLLVNIAEPIKLQDFLSEHKGETENEIYHKILLTLEERMKDTIIYLPDDERYTGLWELMNLGYSDHKVNSLYGRMRWMQHAASMMIKRNPELIEWAEKIAKKREQRGISLKASTSKRTPLEGIGKAAILVLIFPLIVLFTILLIPALILIGIIKPKLKDKTFINSIRHVALYIINVPIQIILYLVSLIFLPWWVCPLMIVGSLAAPTVFYEYLNDWKHLIAYFRLRSDKPLRKALDKIKEQSQKILSKN